MEAEIEEHVVMEPVVEEHVVMKPVVETVVEPVKVIVNTEHEVVHKPGPVIEHNHPAAPDPVIPTPPPRASVRASPPPPARGFPWWLLLLPCLCLPLLLCCKKKKKPLAACVEKDPVEIPIPDKSPVKPVRKTNERFRDEDITRQMAVV